MLRSWGVRMRNVPKLKGRGWRATIKLMERQSLVNSFPEYSSVLSRSPALAVRSNSLQDFVEVTPPPDKTADALEKCEKWLLRPYRFVLQFLGWTTFSDSKCCKGFRCVQVGLWLFFILSTFVTQLLSCFRRDVVLQIENGSFDDENGTRTHIYSCREGFISNFILTDIILFANYIYGIHLFYGDSAEYLLMLAGNVFIKTGEVSDIPKRCSILCRIGTMFAMGIVWILLSFCVRILHIIAYNLFLTDSEIDWTSFQIYGAKKQFLVVYSVFGFIIFDIIYVGAVLNYAVQSELVMDFIWAVRKKVELKQYDHLDNAIKDVIEAHKYLKTLNGKTATAVGLVLFNLCSLGVLSLINLNKINEKTDELAVRFNTPLISFEAAINASLWIGLACFPFVQAVRLTNTADELLELGPQIRSRPRLYSDTPLLELDSFIIVTQAIKLRATMFGVPVYRWLGYGTLLVFAFCILLLLQTNVFSYATYL